MAQIVFQLLQNANGTAAVPDLGGSGLAFYGSTAGSSVQIGYYQDKTYVANADGSTYTDQAMNTKYVANTFPSGMTVLAGAHGNTDTIGLSGIKSFQGTMGIEFNHSSTVNIQNAQLRIYDRSSISNPASGVNTKVAEIINHNGVRPSNQGTLGQTSNAVGSGDCFWWGEPWPAALLTAGKNYYVNSNGVTFYNGTDGDVDNVNGDVRLGAVVGDRATVGGTGIIIPLADSPGSGQRGLDHSDLTGSTGPIWPKWTQYLNDATKQSIFFGDSLQDFGDGSANLTKTYGGTGVDSHHTWSIALSASPLSTGSKADYGLYVSVEYL